MERPWTDADVEAAVIESTRRSGVPLKIEDPATLAAIASAANRQRQSEAS